MRSIASPVKVHASERGIVLVASILFVLLASVLVLVLMTTTTGERTQSSNVQTAKLALYSADAGVRAQQQLLANFAKAKMDSCYAAWLAAGALPNQPIIGNPAAIFPVGVLGSPWAASSTNPAFNASGSITFSAAASGPASQSYDYMYTLTSSASHSTTGKRNVQSIGTLRLSASRGSFSDYLVLVDQFKMSNNGTVYFTSADNFDGRMHTNDGFRFAFRPKFQDRVTQGSANATFYNNGGTVVVANADNNGSIDVPSFYGGYYRSQSTIPLPTNANDAWCTSLGITPSGGVAPTTTQVNTQLGYPSGGAPLKPYVINDGVNVTGGLYINGTATRAKMFADTTTDCQYYQFSVGPNHMSIEVDPGANRTRVWNKASFSGGADLQYTGVPNSVIFATGGINGLTGPDRDVSTGAVPPALAFNQRKLIVSPGDIVIGGDLVCDAYDAASNVMGIWSSGGAVRIGSSAPDNLSLDAFIMACGATTGEFRVDGHDSGSPRGSVTLRGGIVARFYGAFYTWDTNGNAVTGYTRNFHYDRRGLIPPLYPASGVPLRPDSPSARTLAWKEI